MRTVVAVVFLAAALQATLAVGYHRTVSYKGQVVVGCDLSNKEHIQALLDEELVDPWGIVENRRLDIRLSEDLWRQIQHKFPECEVVINDVERFVEKAENETFNATHVGADWFEAYHEYADIITWYQELANSYNSIIKYEKTIGQSVEGRDMPAVHITKDTSGSVPKMYFQCQIHAREWISGAVCMYIANYLCENSEKNEQVATLLNELEFIFIPFVNPDGYSYTWNGDRLWRKNRKVNQGSSCLGVDLNRNYNDHWGGGGSSSNPCSETYRGTSAASEPETQNTQNYFMGTSPIFGAIDWHSFSQLILRPYGWTRQSCPDETVLKSLGDKMRDLAFAVHGKQYTSEKSIDLYITTGTASDWFYSDDANQNNEGYRAAGFTIELRDTGQYGFLLPPDQIIPNGQEMVPAAIDFAQYLVENPLLLKP